MALTTISPFCFAQYRAQTATFASWLADYVQHTPIRGETGWVSWFSSHSGGWPGGVLGRAQYHMYLNHVLTGTNAQLISLVNQIIVVFHRMPSTSQYPLSSAQHIRRALRVLQSETANSPWTPRQIYDLDSGCRIAPISKAYQMLDPHKWTIYDSRVAYALARLVELFWGQNGAQVNPQLLRFPIPDRRSPPLGWTRPRGFPSAGGGHQGHLAFVYSSWLLRQVAEILRSNLRVYRSPPTAQNPSPARILPLNPNWHVYHLEMALWMLGDKPF